MSNKDGRQPARLKEGDRRTRLSPDARREARSRARAAQAAVEALGGPAAIATPDGIVEILEARTEDVDGVTVLDVYVHDPAGGDPHFRIINPPTLVPDASGSVELKNGRRARVDPLAAVAGAIALHGGARRSPRR